MNAFRRAIFLQWDILLKDPRTRPLRAEEFELDKSLKSGLEFLQRLKVLLFVVTVQEGLTDRSLSRREFEGMKRRLSHTFSVDDILVCPHSKDAHCLCRPPESGLFVETARVCRFELSHSVVVSNRSEDDRAASRCGCTFLPIGDINSSTFVGRKTYLCVGEALEAIWRIISR